MALVPFPDSTTTAARLVAVELVRETLGLADSEDGRETALRLGQVGAALVGRYDNCWRTLSRKTPQAVLDEAALRVAGWLKDSPAANVQALSVGRSVAFKFDSTARNALRNSGAMDLLSGWRQHGAGVL